MLKIDTSGEFAAVEASGGAEELAHDICMITLCLARGMIQNGDILSGITLTTLVGNMLTDERVIAEILIGGKIDDALSTTIPEEGEDEDNARIRAQINAMQKFTQSKPIKVDGDYNVIKEDEDE